MKIQLANMRENGCRDLLIYCANAPRCWHSAKINADRWGDEIRLSDLEPLVVCTARGAIGSEVRPDYNHLTKHVTYSYGQHAR
jgi:hypothetical protein